MSENSPLETAIGLVVLAAALTQTWILLQDTTQGDAGRHVSRWWETKVRPQVVRLVAWIDAAGITERMVTEEIEPMLRRVA